MSNTPNTPRHAAGRPRRRSTGSSVRALLIVLETLILGATAFFCVKNALAAEPPVPSAAEATPPAQIAAPAEAVHSHADVEEYIPAAEEPSSELPDNAVQPPVDIPALVDDDGDGIIVERISGNAYSGYMMIVLDPARVTVGCVPDSFGSRGYTVEEMCEELDAVAGINGGDFLDPNGSGNGSTPASLVIYKGEAFYAPQGTHGAFVGFDTNHVMHTGYLDSDGAIALGFDCGVSFGPPLVIDGVINTPANLVSEINPRTAIGQRADGAVLMLVIDGRQVASLGCYYQDIADIMMEYGAVNACNLDGGSSSMMWYDGSYVNSDSELLTIRRNPTAFVVMKEGVN